jgi:hypothetical protein
VLDTTITDDSRPKSGRRTGVASLALRICAILLLALCCGASSGDEVHLSPRFRTVYIREMSDGLDQHLASRLSNAHVLWVVLDPASADAIITDSLDETFWTWLQRTYPPAKTAPAAESTRENPAVSTGQPVRKRGTVFLVDPRQRLVLWSTYELPKNASPAELDRSASRITGQLKAILPKK